MKATVKTPIGLAVEKLYHTFEFHLSAYEMSLEGSDRVILRRGLKLLLETYSSTILTTAIDNFFIDSYAKNANYHFDYF